MAVKVKEIKYYRSSKLKLFRHLSKYLRHQREGYVVVPWKIIRLHFDINTFKQKTHQDKKTLYFN